ncbi:tripartite tricarboxylate transporter substrate binding protein [Candidimonas humi]|jgi:tripartite-type tricarboxylate transporter receptor subunit TctC|uniref:Bug family tripartite tricarboxylate transporter substrate binding protein n=1 Tax=Candidimonas humi TaxID=683355 RepID=A0ABV8NWB1_9BURK|nr:tripartite tricarboxylate transporter substrate binding protein [Candidimonas humi]MBV6304254.1 tripartite tricarboxylate transporter substrate binding protein [Candidimonas humi]
MKKSSFIKTGAVALAACALSAGATAASWPERPITLVVPFTPGGTTDMVARPLAQLLGDELGQSVIVDNRAGAGGTLGAGYAARAKPDGYTIFMSTIAHTIAPAIYKHLPYNFEKDFEPITVVASVPNILIVNKKLPVNSVQQLIDYAKKNPGQVNFGSAGIGSTEDMAGELFKSMTKTDLVHVPYKGGAPMMTDLISGQIQMAIETSGSAAAQIKAGTVHPLAVSTKTRSKFFPDLPTIDASGVPGYDFQTWYGILVPAGTPTAVRDKIYEATVKALKDPKLVKVFDTLGADPGGMKPAEFKTFIVDQTKKWGEIAKAVNMQKN